MGKSRIQTSYEAILELQQSLAEDELFRFRLEGAILLSVPVEYRKKRDILDRTDFDSDSDETEYINRLARLYRDAFKRANRIFDQKLSLSKRKKQAESSVISTLENTLRDALSLSDEGVFYQRRDSIEDPYIFCLMIGNRFIDTLAETAIDLGREMEEDLPEAYAGRGVHSLRGSDRIQRALAAEYMVFNAIMREYLAKHRGGMS